MNLLISSHDYGSALQNRAFLDYFLTHNSLAKVYLYFSDKCKPVYNDLENNYRIDFIQSDFFSKNRTNINFALIGLSESQTSIDKISAQFALGNKIPTGVIQDIWGNTGHFDQDNLPNFFFVIDETAKKLTLSKTTGKANCIITGSPKHANYSKWARSTSEGERNNILFCLQPLCLPGVEENFFYFLNFLSKIDHRSRLQVKLHPDDCGSVDNVLRWVNKFDQTAKIYTDSEIINLLGQAKLVVTCFSTVGIDHNYLNGFSRQPLGNLIYMSVGSDIRNHISKQFGTDIIPGPTQGLGIVVTEKREGVIKLRRGIFDKKLAINYHQKCQEICQYSLNSKKIINDNIQKYDIR